MLAWRRSSGGASAGGVLAGAGGDAPDARSDPHSMQNFAPAGFSAPQLGQVGRSCVPHEMQKRAWSGFSAPQLEQALPFMRVRIGREYWSCR